MDSSWKRIIYLICTIQVGGGITIIGAVSYTHLHSQDRHINVPGTQVKQDRRGGTHNAPTHIHMKPTHMIGGYGQLSYGFNYYGPTGNQRDMTIVARKLKEVDWLED